jgi:hypothetical protein
VTVAARSFARRVVPASRVLVIPSSTATITLAIAKVAGIVSGPGGT